MRKKRTLGNAAQNENFTQGNNQAQTFLLIVLVFIIIFFLVSNFRDILGSLLGNNKNNQAPPPPPSTGGSTGSTNSGGSGGSTNTGTSSPIILQPNPTSSQVYPLQQGSRGPHVLAYKQWLSSQYRSPQDRANADQFIKPTSDIWESSFTTAIGWNRALGAKTSFNNQAELERLIGRTLNGVREKESTLKIVL